jgi:hypothetical protein
MPSPKSGASPQLGCWNNGEMGFGILERWDNGPPKAERKQRIDNILKNTHYCIIPLFHYSNVTAKTQTSKIPYIFIKL